MKPLVPYVRRADWPAHRELVELLQRSLPEAEVVEHGELSSEQLGAVTVAIVDGPSAEQLAGMPDLVLVQSTWAGVEKILPAVPEGVAVARLIDPELARVMSEAVLAWTLYLHRDMPRYALQQRTREWTPHELMRAADRRVGILGLGELGASAAATLALHGFNVAGWSRSPKRLEGVECFDGDDGFGALLARSDIVVNLLPETTATIGLLDANSFAAMPANASLVNFGRGSAVVDDDLLDALDSTHLHHAVLDVFTDEPIDTGNRYWTHDSVTVLPHISGPTTPSTAAVIATDNVRAFLASGALPTAALIDRSDGY